MKRISLFLSIIACIPLWANNTEPENQTLHLSYRNLSSIELDSARASQLVEIDVSGNPIKNLPNALIYAKDLKTVRLNSCKNIEWASLIGLLKKLPVEELEMDFCDLTYIPLELAELKQLRRISLRNNELSDIPWNFFLNQKLEYLNLANNEITDVGKEISYPQQLGFLDLSNNPCINTTLFWKQLPELQNLEVLYINGCEKISSLVVLPPKLKEFHLDNCKASLPKKIGNTDHLLFISLENYAANVSDATAVLSPLAGQARELHFSSVYISKLDNSLLGFTQLEKLQLGCGKLSEVCDLSALKNLKSVSVKSSDSATVDQVLRSLAGSGLSQLDLQGNTFRLLPSSIGKLGSLKQLNLQSCNITNIFKAVASLDSLQELDLRGCSSLDTAKITSYQNKHPNTTVYFDTVYMPATTYDPQPAASSSYIRKPFPDLVLPEEQFVISNKRDTVLIASDGSKITIPANSIVDANNKPVKGSVKISYQTYKTPEEVFASGIPMKADSAGQSFDFASAGMFSLNATQPNGRKAFLSKGKEMKIDFTSDYPNQSYNYYYLDTVQKNWVQTGNDKIKMAQLVKPKPKKIERKKPLDPDKIAYGTLHINVLGSDKPKKEKPRFAIRYSMNINRKTADTILYDPKEIGALNDYDWEYTGPDNKEFFAMMGKRTFFEPLHEMNHKWLQKTKRFTTKAKEGVEFKLMVDKENDCYKFVFSTNTDSLVFPVVPVIHQEDPSKIQKANREMYDNYAKLYTGNTTIRNIRIANYERVYKSYCMDMYLYKDLLRAYKNRRVSYDEYMYMYDRYNNSSIDSVNKRTVTANTVVRSLSLTGFGIYNCDYFTRPQNWIVRNPQFVEEQSGEEFKPANITLIDLADNAYISGVESGIKLARDKDYWIFTTGKDGSIGFAAVTTKNNKPEKIAVKKMKAKTIQELRNELKY